MVHPCHHVEVPVNCQGKARLEVTILTPGPIICCDRNHCHRSVFFSVTGPSHRPLFTMWWLAIPLVLFVVTGTIATGPRSLVWPDRPTGPFFTMWWLAIPQGGSEKNRLKKKMSSHISDPRSVIKGSNPILVNQCGRSISHMPGIATESISVPSSWSNADTYCV